MPIKCPNKSHPDWKALTDGLKSENPEWSDRAVEDRAYTAFFMNGSKIPDVATAMKGITAKPETVVQQAVKTLTPGLDAGRETLGGLRSLILPGSASPEHLKAAETLGSALGTMHRQQESARASLDPILTSFDKMGVNKEGTPFRDNVGFQVMSDISAGRPVRPQFKASADKMTALFDDRANRLEAAGVPIDEVRDNYFPGLWTKESRAAFSGAVHDAVQEGIIPDPMKQGPVPQDTNLNNASQEVKAWIRARTEKNLAEGKGTDSTTALSYVSKRPLKGQESFRKPKVFDDIMTAMEFGLRPVSNNPVDLAMLKLGEMDRSIMANTALRQWEGSGDVINVTNSGRPMRPDQAVGFNPDEWAKIDDKYGTIWTRGATGLPEKVGYRIARKPVADILNNYLSSSLYNNRYFGKAFKGYMFAASTLNQTQLGVLSAFHAGFTTADVNISGGANVIKDTYGILRGNRSVDDLARTAGRAAASTILNPMRGSQVLSEWRDPGSQNPRIKQIAKAAELAGMSFELETGLKTDWYDKMKREWYSDEKLKAAARSPIAFVELSAKPIMEWLVPRQKAGVFAELAGRIIEQNPGKSLEDLTPQFRQAAMRVDARLGQVGYDKLFMNNTVKSVVQGLVRAPGWTGGTIAEVGGAPVDMVRFLKEWHDTGKLPQDIPDRVAYTMSLAITVGVLNGALTYLFTGDHPHGMDFWAFRTGGKDEHGNPERFVLPTYAKDIFAYLQNPMKTLLAKTHPLISLTSDLIKNKDYYGTEIADPSDPFYKRVGERGLYALKQFIPFWMRGAGKAYQRGDTGAKLALPLIGVMPAPSDYLTTDAQKLIYQYQGENRKSGAVTKEERATIDKKKEIMRTYGQDKGAAMILQAEAVRDGVLTARQAEILDKHMGTDPTAWSFTRLPIDQKIEVMKLATPDETKMLLPLLLHTYANELNNNPKRAEKYYNEVTAMVEKYKASQQGG